jgi:hypothetical protein
MGVRHGQVWNYCIEDGFFSGGLSIQITIDDVEDRKARGLGGKIEVVS